MSDQAETPRVLVIRSSEWLRVGDKLLEILWGENTRNHSVYDLSSFLYDSDLGPRGMSCCIGLDGRSFGVPLNDLDQKAFPLSIVIARCDAPEEYLKRWIDYNYHGDAGNNDLAKSASRINDDPQLDDEEKIARLRPIFAMLNTVIDWRPNE